MKNKETIKEFEMVLNAYFFPIKPYDTETRKDKIKKALEKALSKQRKKIVEKIKDVLEKDDFEQSGIMLKERILKIIKDE